MKNVSSIKTNAKNESPKTPGGISKSLLTPCRRVGLSRNWKKKGPTPFISPLNSDTPKNVEVKVEKKQTRKRKSVLESDEKNENVDTDDENNEISNSNTDDIVKTPLRNVELPRRKKSKNFLATLHSQEKENSTNDVSTVSINIDDCTDENEPLQTLAENVISPVISNREEVDPDDKETLSTKNTVQKSNKFVAPIKSVNVAPIESNTIEESSNETPTKVAKLKKKKSESKAIKTRSPNELTKECIVVIQKKLLKVKERYEKSAKAGPVEDKPKETSQPLFESDSDEAPLSTLNKNEKIQIGKPIVIDDDDDEFEPTSSKIKTKKVDSKKASIPETKGLKSTKAAAIKVIPESKPPSQNSFDEDDDFFDKKKTILIRKTYEKVTKPLKAKSTGSITQKDIDNLKARIEVKKKMLLARAMTDETEELRTLIKKWQKGCQEALMELMDLMKIKCPDKHNMDYSEILQMLKIPPSLVGYDSDHDCFNTPDDASAVLSKFNDF